ncbi:MAG: PAS domain-containing sensor histidine kinase, partial [Chthoniobacterales bacterium]
FELTENIPVGTYTMVQPPHGGMAYFSFVSTRFLELTGLEREEARANPMNAFACVHPDDHEEWVRKNAYVFEHKLPFKEECRVVVKGETRWITAESTPRDLPDGSVVWEGVLTDITDRKKAEELLATANRSMQLAASAARLGFWDLDVATGIDHWDEEMARINGIALADFDGHWEKFVHPEDYEAVMRETRRMLESEEIFGMEYRIVRPDGQVRHVRERGVVTRDASGRAVRANGLLQDITEEKEAEERERRLEENHRRDLETKLKTSLSASAVAHEINQPLSTILLKSKMALQEESDAVEALKLIGEEAQRVVVTIEKMKTLLRNVQTAQKPVDLVDVVRSALLYNKGLLARYSVILQATGLDRPCLIKGDDAQLQLAVTNLLRNAAEAIEEADALTREISVELVTGAEAIELVIGDSGPGWTGAEILDLPLTTTKKGGTGIGLYVVRTAVENHRGKISFGRSPLGGAEVRLKFPRVEEKA